MKNMNCVSTMPEIMPEITDEAIIEALFAQRPYEEKVINSAFLEIPAEYQRKLNIPNVEKMSAEFTELIANPPKVSYRDGHYQGEYDPDRLVKRLHTVHPMTLVNDEKSLSGTVSYKYMMLILRTYNGASRRFNLPIKQ